MKTERNNVNSMDKESDATTVKAEESSATESAQHVTEKERSETLQERTLSIYIDVLAKFKRTDPRAIAARDVLEQLRDIPEDEMEEAVDGALKALGKLIGSVIPPKWLYHTLHEPGLNIVFSDRLYFVDGRGSYRKAEQW